jgi:hypothetical protein
MNLSTIHFCKRYHVNFDLSSFFIQVFSFSAFFPTKYERSLVHVSFKGETDTYTIPSFNIVFAY